MPAFSRLQVAMDAGRTDTLVFFVFDLLYLEGESIARLPLIERKERLRSLLPGPFDDPWPLHPPLEDAAIWNRA